MPKKVQQIIFYGLLFLVFPAVSSGASLGDNTRFYIQPSYDSLQRQEIFATLRAACDKAYFYIEDNWWDNLPVTEKTGISNSLNSLASEFCNKIYPTLTLNFGSEWKPGIDQDEKITVLLHKMTEGSGGYFNNGDEYSRIQNPSSNQREMVYLNASLLSDKNVKSYLAHEFIHLITFNQKERIFGVSEDTWLNEARAEYAPTLLGYDDIYEGSYLQKRVRTFLESPSDSLIGWNNQEEDYGVINLFSQYLVDHYGATILTDSMKSQKVGRGSIEEALRNRGFKEDFSQIFSNWTVAVFINNCSSGENYCYFNQNLRNLKIISPVYFLSLVGDSSFSINYSTDEWAGNWYKIIGGKGALTLDFDGSDIVNFTTSYLLCDYQAVCSINSLGLDSFMAGKITISDFSSKYSSLIIIPTVQAKIITGLNYPFSWKASVSDKTANGNNNDLIQKLLAQIDFLKKEIARLQAQLNQGGGQTVTCGKFETDLYFGMSDNQQVRCLQQFLKAKGTAIYPEGLVTGNFYSATLAAVKRYQASKSIIQTGYFGPKSRAAANSEQY